MFGRYAVRRGSILVLIIGLDRFKRLNDLQGRQVGDMVYAKSRDD